MGAISSLTLGAIGTGLLSVCLTLVKAIIIFVVGYLLIRFVFKKLPKAKFFTKLDPAVIGFIMTTLKIILYGLLIVIVITTLGVPMASIIAAITSVFLAIGLALQGSLANFAGGIMLILFKPFKIGDLITCSGGTGVVREISVFYTTLVTDDKNKITIPNGALMNDSVVNHTSEDIRRADSLFTASYDVNLDAVEAKLKAVADANELILKTPEPCIKVLGYSDTGVKCSFRVHCKAENYWDVYFAMNEAVLNVFEDGTTAVPTAKVAIGMQNK